LYLTALKILLQFRRYGLLCLLLCWAACAQEAPRAPARSPEFAEVYRQGLDLLERHRLRAADRAFARCVELDPAAYEGHWQLGRLRLLQGRIDEGVHSLRAALTREPKLVAARALIMETFLGRGREALEEGHYSIAERYFARALEVDPSGYEPLYEASITALWQLKYDRADSLLRCAIEQYPEVLELRWHLAQVWRQTGRSLTEMPAAYRFGQEKALGVASSGHFSEIASELGVDKKDGGRSSAWADFDDDGDLDLVALGHPDLAYYRNDGARFSDRTVQVGLELPVGGIGAQVADYDNDGDADLYITRDGWFGGGANVLFSNSGDGHFVDKTEEAGVGDMGSGFCASWADYDRDGWLDIYVANGTGATGDSTNVLYRNRGDGTFVDVAAVSGVAHKGQSLSSAWGDFDGDSDADLYVCNFTESNVLYRNEGDGSFADITASAGVSAAHIDGFITFVLDYDNDGSLDIFVGNWSEFETVLADRASAKITSSRDRPVLYHNRGDGTFEDRSVQAGIARAQGTMSGVPADIDNDGWVDLYLGNGGPQMGRRDPDVLYRNLGDGTFEDATEALGLGHVGKSHGVTFADYDRDGDVDLYVPSGGAQPGDHWHNAFYRNEGFGHHWLVLKLEGRRSNRDGIGAQISVRCGENKQLHEVASGYSFGNSSSIEAEFGLGDCLQADEIVVRWPSGQVDAFKEVAADRRLLLVEGAGKVRVMP
jgi:tetratricopeptide (TPR) repeat protein